MPDSMTIGRTTQFGVETISGTAPGGGATKQITDLTVTLDPAFSVTEVRGTGQRFDASVNPDGQERITGKVGGGLGYNSFMYPASMIWGASTDTTPVGGINARQHLWTPALTGSIPPKTMDIEMGDAQDAEQVLYALLTDLGVDMTRAACAPSGNLLARALTKAAAGGPFTGMTVTGITSIPIVPILPLQWGAYMDDLAANIGNTQLLRCFHSAINYASAYVPFFALNPSVTSYAGVADNAAVQETALLELMKDSVGEGLWKQARNGMRKYIRLKAVSGQYIDNYQTLTVTGVPTGGSFLLTYKGQSATINWNNTTAQTQTALTALATVGAGNVTVTGGVLPGATQTIAFTGLLANDATGFTVGTNSLTGGASPAGALVATAIPYSLQIDFCGSVKMPGPQADNQSLRVRQWDFIMVADPNWLTGQGFSVTLVNALASL